MSTALAVCALLLGRKAAAAAELGLGPDAAREPDAGVQEFVLVSHAGAANSLTVGHAAHRIALLSSGQPCNLPLYTALPHGSSSCPLQII